MQEGLAVLEGEETQAQVQGGVPAQVGRSLGGHRREEKLDLELDLQLGWDPELDQEVLEGRMLGYMQGVQVEDLMLDHMQEAEVEDLILGRTVGMEDLHHHRWHSL